MKNYNKYLLSLLSALLLLSCKTRKHQFEIIKKPVFSEDDPYLTSAGYLQHNKHDYFLVRTDISDKKQPIEKIDSFVRQSDSKKFQFDNYLMFFYKESEYLNESIVKGDTSQSKYKIFFTTKKIVSPSIPII